MRQHGVVEHRSRRSPRCARPPRRPGRTGRGAVRGWSGPPGCAPRPSGPAGDQVVERLLDLQVLAQHGHFEVDRPRPCAPASPSQVVPPQRGEEAARVGRLGLDEEPDHVGAAGLDEVDAQAAGGRARSSGRPSGGSAPAAGCPPPRPGPPGWRTNARSDMVKDQSSRATAYCGTSAASSAPKVPAWTKGKWATSRKLSASSPADARVDHGRQLARDERRVVGLGDRAERGDRLLGGQEHHAVRLDQAGRADRRAAGGRAAPGPEGRDLHAGARGVEAPAVVGALRARPPRSGRATGACGGGGSGRRRPRCPRPTR